MSLIETVSIIIEFNARSRERVAVSTHKTQDTKVARHSMDKF